MTFRRTLTGLEGQSGTRDGIAYGYVAGNLVFEANKWNGGYNPGEFTVTGTSFTVSGTIVKYYFFNGQRVAMRDDTGVYYLLGDHLGTTSVVLDADGDKVAESRHYPYGEERWSSGTLPTDYRFTGQREDSSIKLTIMGARWYDSGLGRWISADTLVPQPGNPQALNRYSYCIGNPLKYIDPSGHRWDDFLDFVRGIPGYKTTANNLDKALTIVQHPETSAGEKALAGGYMLVEGVAHGALVVGGAILAWEGVVAVAGAACADGNPTNEAKAAFEGIKGLSADGDPFNEGREVALGLGDYLFEFERQVVPGAHSFPNWERVGLSGPTWPNFSKAFESAMNNASGIHFNFTGIDNVSNALTRGMAGWGPGNMTSTELYLIANNPDWFAKTSFYLDGVLLSAEEVLKLLGGQ